MPEKATIVLNMEVRSGSAQVVPGRYRALIRHYFDAGYTYEAIVSFLDLIHGIKLPLRSLKRFLSLMGLKRRGLNQDLGHALRCIEVSLIQN